MPPASLTAAELGPLLDIIARPDHPAFTQAVKHLAELDPATLTPDIAATLHTRLQTIMDSLHASKSLTTEQLTKLRASGQALQSYSNR